jgi:uncharacterized phiE125 gp8 family phage protein
MLRLERTSGPTSEPITTAEAKSHLRVDSTDHDTRIDALIRAAREYVEQVTRRALMTQTWKLYLDDFPLSERIDLPRPPIQSVTLIEYVDTDGATQTLDASQYRVDSKTEPGRITEAEGVTWPATDQVTNAVTITYDAGYGGTAADVPQAIQEAIQLQVELLFDRPDSGYAKTLRESRDALLAPYRVFL